MHPAHDASNLDAGPAGCKNVGTNTKCTTKGHLKNSKLTLRNIHC